MGPDDGFGWVGFDEGWRVGCGVDVRGVAGLEVRATIRDDVDTEEQAATVTRRSKTPIDVLTQTLPLILLISSDPYGERSSPEQRKMADIVWQWSDSASVGLIGDPRPTDAGRVSEQIVCSECGSASVISSGVFEHGTWIHRLTCWTCRDCRTIFAVPGAEASGLDPEGIGSH